MTTKRQQRVAALGFGAGIVPPTEEIVGKLPQHTIAGPVRAVGETFNQFRADIDVAREMLEKGEHILEIDPALIDPSFARDRMAAFDPEGADAEFVAAIRSEGQLVPTLLRPNPAAPGRFQPAYGRRRIAAAAFLNRKVRAVVRDLSDEQLVVAQGQENEARNGLTFIEKCRFAATLEAQGFKRKVIERALTVAQPHLSAMLQIVETIPGSVIDWIGAAPGIGRRRWIELSRLGDGPESRSKMISFVSGGVIPAGMGQSDDRFNAVVAATAERAAPGKPASMLWALPGQKKPYGSIEITPRSINMSIDRKASPAIAEALLERLESIRRELEAAASANQPQKG